jgi:D-arginine dehydrogenase
MTRGEALAVVPFLRPEVLARCYFEPDNAEIDVEALHQGYLRGIRRRGGATRSGVEFGGAEWTGTLWRARVGDELIETPQLVNAAGAWADVVAEMAGAKSVGLVPKRRTAFTFDAPAGLALDTMPMVIDFDETWYFKPEVGQFLASPADETPSPPCDAQPEEMDIAVAVDRIEAATTLEIRRIKNKWAGLRSFVADKNLVVGYDPVIEGLFWLAGQGGYGIQTGESAGRLAASLARGKAMPGDIAALGVAEAALSPARFTQR